MTPSTTNPLSNGKAKPQSQSQRCPNTTSRPGSSGSDASSIPSHHSPTMLFSSHSSTDIKRPSSRASTSRKAGVAGSSMRSVGGLLVDQDGEMHDPSYAQSLQAVRSQLSMDAPMRAPSHQQMPWRNSFARNPSPSPIGLWAGAEGDRVASDDDEEEDSAAHVREAIHRRRGHSIPTTTNCSTDSTFTAPSSSHAVPRTVHVRRPGSAGASVSSFAQQQLHRGVLGQNEEANSSMEMLQDSSSPVQNERPIKKNSVRRLRDASRSRAGSVSSAGKKRQSVPSGGQQQLANALDDWSGSFTGIVDIQREERSRRSSNEAMSSVASLTTSGPSTRPASPDERGSSRHGSSSARASQSFEEPWANGAAGAGSSGSLRRKGSRRGSLSKRKVTEALIPRNKSKSVSSESGREHDIPRRSTDLGIPALRSSAPSMPSLRTTLNRSSTAPKSLNVSTRDLPMAPAPSGSSSSKRTSPARGIQDLPLLTPLDEDGGYREYYQSIYGGQHAAAVAANQSLDASIDAQGMLRSYSERSTTGTSSLNGSGSDVLHAVRRKMESVSLGVKMKAFKVEKKIKKKFSSNDGSEASGADAWSKKR